MPIATEAPNLEQRPSDGVLDLQPEPLRQTRDQISAIVTQIAVAAKKIRRRSPFFALALERLHEAMGAVGTAIWEVNDQGEWMLVASHQLPSDLLQSHPNTALHSSDPSSDSIRDIEFRLDAAEALSDDAPLASESETASTSNTNSSEAQLASAWHQAIQRMLTSEQQPTLVPPTTAPPPGRPRNPTSHCLVYAPMLVDSNECKYWLQAVLHPAGGPTTYRGYLRFLVQIAEIVSEFLKSYRLRELNQEKGVFDTAQGILRELDLVRKQAANLAPNTMSLGQQEESVVARGIMRWAKADEAIFVYRDTQAHRIRIGARANDLKIAEHGEAASTLRRFIESHLGTAEANLPRILSKEQDKGRIPHDLFGAEAMLWLPIHLDQPRRRSTPIAFVALILLWYRCEEDLDQSSLTDQFSDIGAVATLGTRYALASPASQALNAMVSTTRKVSTLQRMLSQPLTRVLLLFGLLAIACCVPVPLTLTAPATLVPQQMQIAYAPASGVVGEVLVRYGQAIEAGQPILRIKSDDLENEYESLVAERVENEQRRRDIELHLLRSNELTAQQRSSLEGELQTLNVIARTQSDRVKLLEKQIQDLEVCSRIKGVVGTWKIESQLHGKPVALGQPLATIYDPESKWGFEIELQEQDIGQFVDQVKSQSDAIVQCRMDSDPLKTVDLALKTTPEDFVIHLSSEGQSMVPLYAEVDPRNISQLTPGATGTVEVVVGKQPVIWVLTRELVLHLWAKTRLWL